MHHAPTLDMTVTVPPMSMASIVRRTILARCRIDIHLAIIALLPGAIRYLWLGNAGMLLNECRLPATGVASVGGAVGGRRRPWCIAIVCCGADEIDQNPKSLFDPKSYKSVRNPTGRTKVSLTGPKSEIRRTVPKSWNRSKIL